jgi:long-chain fatty acid transport protein
MIRTAVSAAALMLFAGVAATDALAGAFQLNERSARALGASLAGSASSASDVAFAAFNPAALGTVERFEAAGNAALVMPIADGTIQDGPFAGTTLDGDVSGIVPSMALGYRVTDKLVIGFTSYSPFGLRTEYGRNSPVQADARKSELVSLSLSPSLSYDLMDNLTFGAALDILYADAKLTSAPVDLEGHDWEVAFSLGLLFRPAPTTQIGAAYHHGYDLDFDTRSFGGFPGLVEASLPNWAQLGITQEVGDGFRLMAEGRWINWSRFDSIEITTPALEGTAFGRVSDVQNYDDAWFFAVGAEYDLNDRLTLRGGVAYDETPTSDAWRTVRVPDEDRLWLSGGASYAVSDRIFLDVSYSYLHALSDPEVTLRNGPLAGTRLEYDGGAHIVSIGGSFRFLAPQRSGRSPAALPASKLAAKSATVPAAIAALRPAMSSW